MNKNYSQSKFKKIKKKDKNSNFNQQFQMQDRYQSNFTNKNKPLNEETKEK